MEKKYYTTLKYKVLIINTQTNITKIIKYSIHIDKYLDRYLF